ncbi:MAG TPA: tetratricopeptide repeat protein [Gemmatimonadales bacterium]
MAGRSRVPIALTLVLASCAVQPRAAPTVEAIVALQGMTASGREPPRPRLPPGSDTNSAVPYYERAVRLARSSIKLDTADIYLYWASRLDPAWADPIFLRGVLILRAFRKDALDVLWRTGSPRAARQVQLPPGHLHRVDSLLHVAWGRNPLVFSDLDPPPFWGSPGDPTRGASFAFTMRRFAEAESLFAQALRKYPDDPVLRIYRARALFYLQRYDSAVVELMAARDTVRGRAETGRSVILPSVEMFEFAIGIIRVQQDDFPAARAAFERALTENLGFYWAHVRLAGSALGLHDTTSALRELDEAIQLEGSDPVLRLYDGAVLNGVGRREEAATQLQRAIALDPYYAEPYYWLALVYDAQGKTAEAIVQYRQFLAHAAGEDPKRASALRNLTVLGAVSRDSS